MLELPGLTGGLFFANAADIWGIWPMIVRAKASLLLLGARLSLRCIVMQYMYCIVYRDSCDDARKILWDYGTGKVWVFTYLVENQEGFC